MHLPRVFHTLIRSWIILHVAFVDQSLQHRCAERVEVERESAAGGATLTHILTVSLPCCAGRIRWRHGRRRSVRVMAFHLHDVQRARRHAGAREQSRTSPPLPSGQSSQAAPPGCSFRRQPLWRSTPISRAATYRGRVHDKRDSASSVLCDFQLSVHAQYPADPQALSRAVPAGATWCACMTSQRSNLPTPRPSPPSCVRAQARSAQLPPAVLA